MIPGLRSSAVAVGLTLGLACMSVSRGAKESALCASTSAASARWQLIDLSAFSFRAPGPVSAPVRLTIDSQVERFAVADGLAYVEYDLGKYNGPPVNVPDVMSAYEECDTRIDGRPTRMATYLLSPDVADDPRALVVVEAGWLNISEGTHLNVRVEGRSPADLPMLLAILRSVDIR